ncbi:Glycerol-3-phosphate 1-O-acyltransferase [Desulfonema limicola]|uniref:Glycerol-3-phosphate acyltransferase n=1 Tax=Desulfonema limicola TaxID=45656 RepID=A0A975B3E0_9BACT|nr:glycerol-3-phosphate 1-O-acyltransferase PlsY [Desulfonema limicola]QTA78055.1 Glycerol-3-phosphate 1-O-acyltransferase [Desulfonema limicola]
MELMKIAEIILLPFAGYLLGSIPWGLVLTSTFTSVNLRETGSRNTGATNVRRTAGTFMGLLTLMGDVLKGFIPVLIAVNLTNSWHSELCRDFYVSIIILGAFTGHLYPVFLKFKHGGKGIATAGGCFLAVSPIGTAVAVLVFILFVCMTSRVSAGSLAGSFILPLAVWKASGSESLTLCACIIGIWIFFRHKDNIKRLAAGTEPGI